MLRTVAVHEFIFTIKRKTFYLVTLGMPLIVLAYAGFITLIVYTSTAGELKQLSKPVGIIDHSGILTAQGAILHDIPTGEIVEYEFKPDVQVRGFEELIDQKLTQMNMDIFKRKLKHFEDLDSARSEIEDEQIKGAIVIPEVYLNSGQVHYYLKTRNLISTTESPSFLHRLLVDSIMERGKLSADEIARIRKGPAIYEFELNEQGTFVPVNLWSKGFSLGIPLSVCGLLMVALMMNGSLLLASIAEEKENKVMEIILSSVRADQLLFGKVLGLVAAGVLQITIWLLMAGIVPALTMAILKRNIDYDIPVVQLVFGILFVLLGFVFYGCLMAGFGSLGTTYKDCQQLTVAVILCAIVPLMTLMTFLNDPNGVTARLLSFIPLFSPTAMMLRLGITAVPWWEVTASLIVLLLSIWGVARLSGRLFRAGTLMYGKRPGLSAIYRALREPL